MQAPSQRSTIPTRLDVSGRRSCREAGWDYNAATQRSSQLAADRRTMRHARSHRELYEHGLLSCACWRRVAGAGHPRCCSHARCCHTRIAAGVDSVLRLLRERLMDQHEQRHAHRAAGDELELSRHRRRQSAAEAAANSNQRQRRRRMRWCPQWQKDSASSSEQCCRLTTSTALMVKRDGATSDGTVRKEQISVVSNSC